MRNEPKFYIKDVAKMTGLSEQLIRKWETRYQVVEPERLANGYRVYSKEDTTKLIELKNLRDQRIPLKDAVQMILNRKKTTDSTEQSSYVELLIEKGTVYDEEAIFQLLKQAHHQYGLEQFLQNTVRPFLLEVGNLWGSKTWDESQESVSSLAVRDYLTEVDRHFQIQDDAPHALGFCLPGELHDIPLQILLLQMKMNGWRTTRIAASPKFTAIERLIKHLKPDKVLLSASTLIPFEKAEHLLHDLDQIAKEHPEIKFYLGGQGAWEYTKSVKSQAIIVGCGIDDVLEKSLSN